MEDRRMVENTLLRELVDAMAEFMKARDALWSLGIFDRLFRAEKCRTIINEYDLAARKVREAIRTLSKLTKSGGPDAPIPDSQVGRLVSEEEFEMLIGKHGFPRAVPA